ncbi:hypothetical protein RT717_16280 [Imperialibacter roseus]|uniref:Uncharacterized protein n=1 Tax=Imperialibacter roseus TaxID=1324217 RepID=A0ABZ0IHY1_9BACT|nr:hypothetical protein [Imperialibacter roseus]WOK04638.1 hypothetical protein RT717_16280 [Imperialibacter roseus]
MNSTYMSENEMIKFLRKEKGLSQVDAWMLSMVVVDLNITKLLNEM